MVTISGIIQCIWADIYQVIKSGLVQTPKSGISNSGPWGYPTISGSYLPSKACTVKVSCLSITPSKKDPEKIKFNYSIDGNPPSDFTLTAKIDTITKGQKDEKDRGKDIKKITGWSTETLNNGLTFTFENMDGTPVSYSPGIGTDEFLPRL